MVCMHCGGSTRVVNSRSQHKNNQVWRRRQCEKCQAIFTTIEAADYSANWLVADSNRQLSTFNPDKLFLSLYNSLQHRKTAIADARAIANTVTAKLRPGVKAGVLDAKTITGAVQVALNRFDKVASVHFAALHR